MSEGENDKRYRNYVMGRLANTLIKYFYNDQKKHMKLAKIVETSTHIFMVLRHDGA